MPPPGVSHSHPKGVPKANGKPLSKSAISIGVSDAWFFEVDDVIAIEKEFMKITSINMLTSRLRVKRGFAGSEAASHADRLTVDLVTNVGRFI